ncbi:MAG: four helix bundle protein [Bacteroidota bacterium]|nr:four helix bundle protein [Bacteroidota bacterium]
MIKRQNYKKLDVFQKSLSLATSIVKDGNRIRPIRFMEQIVSSAVSIPSNIAEGAQMESYAHFLKYLRISLGSAAELETQLTIMKQANYSQMDQINKWLSEVQEIQAMLVGLMGYFRKQANSKL